MNSRIGSVAVVSLVLATTSFAQITPISGSRGISVAVTNIPNPYSYSASASVHTPVFDDAHSFSVGGASGQVRIESELLPNQWRMEGSMNVTGVSIPSGQLTSTSVASFASLTFAVEAGTLVSVDAMCRGTWGGGDSRISMSGGGFSFSASAGQIPVYITQQRLVTEASVISISASGSTNALGTFGDRYGLYEVLITATTVPAPSSAGILALAAAGCFARRRRVH